MVSLFATIMVWLMCLHSILRFPFYFRFTIVRYASILTFKPITSIFDRVILRIKSVILISILFK